jgi:RHS repeat-associated protein
MDAPPADSLGSARAITDGTGVLVYDADFTPFGGERAYTYSYPTIFKFEGKQRDNYTSNDFFGARYYSNRWGRWLSADWSNVPAPVPYANLSNPQTLNLYSMVADDPESFADLDGHTCQSVEQMEGPLGGKDRCPMETAQKNAEANNNNAANNQNTNKPRPPQAGKKKESDQKTKVVVTPVSDTTHPSSSSPGVKERDIIYTAGTLDKSGAYSRDDDAKITLTEKQTGGNSTPTICSAGCTTTGGLEDQIAVPNSKAWFTVEQQFSVNGKSVSIARIGPQGEVVLAPKQVVHATATEINVTPSE